MFPTSGYFRAVHCPFFLSGLCERPYCHFRHSAKAEEKVANKAETGPSYSTSGPRSYQQAPSYNQGPLHPQSSYNQSDVARYSTLSPSEPTGPVETYKTASSFEISSCNIPNFTNSDQNLPETLEDPLNLASLPKISGLPKPKQSNTTLPSYVPTPKTQFQPVSVSAPTYNPTPKAASERKQSRTIEYDPVKNFAFIERKASSDEESNDEADKEEESKGDKNCQPKDGKSQPEGEFSEEETPNEAKATWLDDDLTDSDEDVSCRHEKTAASIEDKLMDFAALLTPSSQITGKLDLLSGDKKTKDSHKKVNSEQSVKPGTNLNSKIVSSSSSRKNRVSPDSTSTPQASVSSESLSQKKSDVSIHRSHSSSSNSSKLKSSSERHRSVNRSLSESHSASRSSSNSSLKTSKDGSSESDSKAAAEHSSKSSSKSTSSQKSSSTSVHLSSSQSKSPHSSSRDKKESVPPSTNSKRKHSSTEISQKLLKHTSRAGSSNSEKENRLGSKSKHSDSSSSKTSSSNLSSSKPSSTKTDDALLLKSLDKAASKHKSLDKKTNAKVEELVHKNKVKCEVSSSVSSTSVSSTKSRSSSCDGKSDSAPINNLVEAIVKKERRDSQENRMPHKDTNKSKTKHKSDSKESNKQSAVSIKEEKQVSKDSAQKNGKNVSDPGKYSNSGIKLEKQATVHTSTDLKAGKVRHSGKVGASAHLMEESEGSDSDVQIIEMPPPQILELSESEEEVEEAEERDDDGGFSDEVSMLSDSDTFDECLKIFQESERQLAAKSRKASLNPDQSKGQMVPTSFEKAENILAALSKKRMAHKAADKSRKPVTAPVQIRPKMSPAEVMHNRIVEMQKRALLRAAVREGRESELPSGLSGKSPQLPVTKSKLAITSTPSLLASAADSLLSSSKKREAHMPKPVTQAPVTPTKAVSSTSPNYLYSPNSFYSKKKGSEALKPAENPDKIVTIAGTASKTEKRKAHEPTMTNLKRPIIPAAFGDKVPSNIRQRYLNIIIEEYLKFSSEEVAFQKGQEEEQAAYGRAPNKNIYLGLVANAIKKIRAEASECQPSSSKKVCPGPTTLSSMASLPSHVAQSHAATLGGSHAAKTSFTLNRSGSSGKPLLKDISGKEFYERLKKYILTEQELRDNGYPRPAEDGSNKVVFYKENAKDSLLKDNERTCRRCGKRYYVTKDGSPATSEKCLYHYSSAYKTKIAGSWESRYSCCNERADTKGCQIAECHVNERNKTDNLSGYMKTLPSPDKDFKVYSLDCEMVYTKAGLELARVTVVGEDCETVYESLVKPETEVIDYNTRFSGITEADMRNVTTNLLGVQAVMLSLVSDKTILMGHSLESDLVALKLIHSTVVDTSLVFPHRLGLPYKKALRTLTVEILQKIIQDNAGGHDSKEDAAACMLLMQHKVKEDAKRENRRC